MNERSDKSASRLSLTQIQVMSTGFTSMYRDELIAIERRIMDITGKSADCDDKWRKDQAKFKEVKGLLTKRWNLLN